MASRIIVTGGSGFIGTNLIERFSGDGHQVLNLDIVPPRNPAHCAYWRQGDLLAAKDLKEIVRSFEPNIILHMGARTDLDGTLVADYAANTTGVANLISASEDIPSLRRVIFASSRLVCRIGYQPIDEKDYCPTTSYGESKVLGEKIVRRDADRLKCPWVILRPTSIWGPWFDVPYKTFFLTIAKGRYFHTGGSAVYKSFGYVGNTVYEIQRLLEAEAQEIGGKTLYLADYPPVNVEEMANAIQEETKAARIRTIPVPLLRVAARAGDFAKRIGLQNPPITSFRLDNLLTPMLHDLTALERIAGPLPYNMKEGIRLTAAWLRSQGAIK